MTQLGNIFHALAQADQPIKFLRKCLEIDGLVARDFIPKRRSRKKPFTRHMGAPFT